MLNTSDLSDHQGLRPCTAECDRKPGSQEQEVEQPEHQQAPRDRKHEGQQVKEGRQKVIVSIFPAEAEKRMFLCFNLIGCCWAASNKAGQRKQRYNRAVNPRMKLLFSDCFTAVLF